MSDERLFLLVAIAGRTVAIDAAEVGSVIEMDEVTPVPRVPPHVVGLFALRSRVLTVIDARTGLADTVPASAGALSAVVLEIEGHSYALIVDEVLDVVTVAPPAPVTAVLGSHWARVVTGRISVGEEPVLVVSPQAIISGPEAIAA